MSAINEAIKLNIQYHFERFCQNTDEGCSGCPFKEECQSVDSHESRCLCEIITGKKMNNMFDSHDITHCGRNDCPKCNTCHRYLMYLDAKEKKINYISLVVPDKVPCEIYWEEKND